MGNDNSKPIDNKGVVNNNIKISETVQVHNDEIVLMLKIIVGLLIVQLLFKLYKVLAGQLKRKYQPQLK